MKKLYNLAAIFCAANLIFACMPQEEYVPGEPEDPNCAGVYFPTQELPKAFAPEDSFSIDVKVARTKSAGDVTVPTKIYGNEKGYFTVPELKFLDGQSETDINVTFSKEMPLGEECSITIAIEDPAYASVYGKNASFVAIPVVIENYKYLGDAEFWDEFEFGESSYKVPLYQNVTNPNEFRLINPYNEGNAEWGWTSTTPAVEKLNFKIIEPGTVFNKDEEYEFTVKGEDLVYFEDYYTGDSSNGIDVVAYSPFENSVYWIGKSESDCADSKVVNYQDPDAEGNVLPAVVQLMPTYLLGDGSGRGWGPSPVTILFPGGAFVDYSLSVSSGECKEGKSPLTFKFGKDVVNVKYLVYSGELTAKQIRQEVALIGAGEKKADSLDVKNPVIAVECEATGLYTIVAVAFDKNNVQQSSTSAVFGYVKPGDEEDVKISFDAALEDTPSRYFSKTISQSNSLLFYMVGDNISLVRYNLYDTKKHKVEEKLDSLKAAVQTEGKLLDEDDLELVNGQGGLCDIFTGLTPLTDYTLIVYAYNGYVGKTVVSSLKTSGLPLEKVGTGIYTYNVLSPIFDLPEAMSYELDLMFDPNTENCYQVADYYEEPLPFKTRKDTTLIDVPACYVGGGLFAQELTDWVQEMADLYEVPVEVVYQAFELQDFAGEHSYYDKDSDTYYFCLMFFDDEFYYGYGYEKFAMNAENVSKVASKMNIDRDARKHTSSFNGMKAHIPSDRIGIQAERDIRPVKVSVSVSSAQKGTETARKSPIFKAEVR